MVPVVRGVRPFTYNYVKILSPIIMEKKPKNVDYMS